MLEGHTPIFIKMCREALPIGVVVFSVRALPLLTLTPTTHLITSIINLAVCDALGEFHPAPFSTILFSAHGERDRYGAKHGAPFTGAGNGRVEGRAVRTRALASFS